MIVDFHTHAFPDDIAAHAVSSLQNKSHSKAFSDGTEKALAEHAEKAGIGLSVVLPVATDPGKVRKINENAADSARSFERGVIHFACIHPAVTDIKEEVSRIKELGFLGIKIHPVYQGTGIDSLPYLKILEAAADLGLIVVTHSGSDIGFPGAEECVPKKVRKAVNAVDPEGKKLKFVAAHMGGWRMWDEVPDELADTGVYIDTAFSTGRFYPSGDGFYEGKDTSLLDEEGFMKIFDAFGAERVLFGTDSPWSDPKESIDFIRSLPATENDKELILGGNAERLLGIKDRI